MDKRRTAQRMEEERAPRDDRASWSAEREDLAATLKKARKAQLAYLKNTEWMFSNQHFGEPLEHMPNYF